MKQTVEPNKTLLIDGAASVTVVSGKVQVFGSELKESAKLVIREGKRLPLFILERAVLDVSMGASASIEEVDGSTIPVSWQESAGEIAKIQSKPAVIMLFGKADCGKSSYCTYLLNRLVNDKCSIAVLDGDLGQSDIGPSGTLAYAITTKQVAELYDLKLENAFFVGVTSPIQAITKIIEGLVSMKAEILQKSIDFVLINTDGWVVGDDAVRIKSQLVKELKPDFVVGIQVEDELKPLLANIENTRVIVVESSPFLKNRSAEKRRNLREMSYAKYLKNAKQQNYRISQLVIDDKATMPKNRDSEKGLLVGFYNSQGKFLGIGVLREIDNVKRNLKVQTPISVKPARVVFGKLHLDDKFREIQA